MYINNAYIAMGHGSVCWIGKVVSHCKECGKNIKKAKRVEVKTPEQYLKELGKL